MTLKFKHPGLVAGAIGGLLCMQLEFAAAQSVSDLVQVGEDRIQQAQAQQEEIDAIVDVTDDRFDQYQVLLREIEDLEIFNNLMRAQVNAQRRELDDLYTAIDEVGYIERQILPLMTRMIDGLERFIQLDVPFLVDERLARVEARRQLLTRADVTAAEQFRNVMEAWMIEMDYYGTTGEIFTDEIVTADGVTREVELLRIGRVALVYVTPDGSQAGAWDQRNRQWVTLGPELVEEIRAGFDAYETETPAMFVVPVPAPEEG
jgi:hypothetical protein